MITSTNGLIDNKGDGGDTLNRMYTTFIRLQLQGYETYSASTLYPPAFYSIDDAQNTEELLEPYSDGIWIRNPDNTKWYSDSRNVSRDQLTPVICYYSILSDKNARQIQGRLLKACLKRGMFAQNTYPNWIVPMANPGAKKVPDFITPDLWAVFARTWIKTPWLPLALPTIILGDIFLVFTALAKVFAPISGDGTLRFRAQGPNDVDDDNINNILMTTQYVFPTPFSWLARKIYKTFRKKNYGNINLGEKNPIMGALMWYHRDENIEIAEIARPLVEKY